MDNLVSGKSTGKELKILPKQQSEFYFDLNDDDYIVQNAIQDAILKVCVSIVNDQEEVFKTALGALQQFNEKDFNANNSQAEAKQSLDAFLKIF